VAAPSLHLSPVFFSHVAGCDGNLFTFESSLLQPRGGQWRPSLHLSPVFFNYVTGSGCHLHIRVRSSFATQTTETAIFHESSLLQPRGVQWRLSSDTSPVFFSHMDHCGGHLYYESSLLQPRGEQWRPSIHIQSSQSSLATWMPGSLWLSSLHMNPIFSATWRAVPAIFT
jgi:hypothetical protein